MLTLRPGVLRDIAQQSTTELATVLVNLVVDRARMYGHGFEASVRPHWEAELQTDPTRILRETFVYDVATGDQAITVWSNAEQPFVLVTARFEDEPEIEAILVGDGFAMNTRHLLRADWTPIADAKARELGVQLDVLRTTFP